MQHELGLKMANIYFLFTLLKMLPEGKIGNEWWYIQVLHRLIFKDDEGDNEM